MLDKKLIRNINSGRCLVLVGSGPSCEVGYPSWHQLAADACAKLQQLGKVSDQAYYDKHLLDRDYPDLFRKIERDLSDNRPALVEFLKPLLTPTAKRNGRLYEILSKWPFACYLTTNYDDEIERHLIQAGRHPRVIRNRKTDFYVWRDGVIDIIQKLHSDLDHPDELILTTPDYERFTTHSTKRYFRDRLRAIFTTFNILVIGHSLSDPDIKHILSLAKEISDPTHPIYFICADLTKGDEEDLLEKYNIVAIPYENADGKHSQLLRLLRTVDRFIPSQSTHSTSPALGEYPSEEVEAAMALSLYRRLQGIEPAEYLVPLILAGLREQSSDDLTQTTIASLPLLRDLATDWTNYGDSIEHAVIELREKGFITSVGDTIRITSAGTDTVEQLHAIRDAEKVHAYSDFLAALTAGHPEVTPSQLDRCRDLAEAVIVHTFAVRGSVIANKIYSGQSALAAELSDVFGQVSDQAVRLDDPDLRAAFIEAVYEFIVEPRPAQRAYLQSVSQGYFLYHLLGRDPKFIETRAEIFRKTLWFCDSSVLLPLVAVGCHNHDYAVDLFQKLSAHEAVLCITPNLVQEVWEHFKWAVNFARSHNRDSLEFLRAATVGGSYKQNLFLDGYIRLSADGVIGTFTDYLATVLPSRTFDRSGLEENITQRGVLLLRLPDLAGYSESDTDDIDYTRAEIQQAREDRLTYRSPLQVEAEAEILVLLRNLRSGKYSIPNLTNIDHFYFISQSNILDRVLPAETVTTWSPEAVYRYLTVLPKATANPDLLQQCMLHEYFYAGISFIDSDRYTRFFGTTIDLAKASYETEKAQYVADLEDTYTRNIDVAFERATDLEKPFFTAQMAWRVVRDSQRREEAALRRASDAERRLKVLLAEKETAWKTRVTQTQEQEDARRRNLSNPKHVQKRRRQAKKRKKGKK